MKAIFIFILSLFSGNMVLADTTLLNVSFDSVRQLDKEYNEYFKDVWFEKTGGKISIFQSHGGSGKQARSVAEGLEADIVHLATANDIYFLVKKGIIDEQWEEDFPYKSTPFFSTVVFVSRKGNPKKIFDWEDLTKNGIVVVTPNPKTSGGARWNYIAAYGYALIKTGDENFAKNFVKKIYANVPVLDSSSRGAVINFTKRGLGDVLVTWESEAYLILDKMGKDNFEIVYPSISVKAEPKIALLKKVKFHKERQNSAVEYLRNLYSEYGQKIAIKNYFRPVVERFSDNSKNLFPDIKLFSAEEVLGSWANIQKVHFGDGGIFDNIFTGFKYK